MVSEYRHLLFRKHWILTEKSLLLLGQCEAFVKAICNTPILPEHHSKLLSVSLIKGAQATTAIEGNTLTDEEIERLKNGNKLPPSKEYQGVEVNNILEAFNILLNEVVQDNKMQVISVDLLLRLHQMIGKELGEHFDAIPGKFRNNNVTVGRYKCPDYQDVPELINKMCQWLLKEFNFLSGDQKFYEITIQAIVAHIYIEWIHPFGDGNGRTGRLLEFYILLRGGNPDIASHILSNHYNMTRADYYRQIENATKKSDLTDFIEYALVGFRDGLEQTLKIVQDSQFSITWQKHIHDKFADTKTVKSDVLKRRRELVLCFPADKGLTKEECTEITPRLAKLYARLSLKSVHRDLQELQKLDLIYKESNKYFANTQTISAFTAKRRLNRNIA